MPGIKHSAHPFLPVLMGQLFITGLGLLALTLSGIGVNLGEKPYAAAVIGGLTGAFVTYTLLLLAFRYFLSSFRKLSEEVENMHRSFAGFTWPQLIVIAILAGVGEELLFRGFAQNWIAGQSDVYLGIAVASLLFGLVHATTLSYFLLSALIGCILGVAYVVSGSLLLIIVWHAAYDILALAVLKRFPHLLGIHPHSVPSG